MNNTYYLLIFIILFGILNQCKSKSEKTPTSSVRLVIDTSGVKSFPIDCSIRAIEAIDDNTIWFTGTRGMYGYTMNGGTTWYIDSLDHPDHDELQFRSIAVTSKSVFLLSIGSPAVMYKSDDWGKSWEVVYEEHDSLAFYDAIAFWDDIEGIAMGDPTSGCISVIKTSDGGNSWDKISCNLLPPAYEGEAAFAASNSNIAIHGDNVWIVSGGSKARVFRSSDKGNSWDVSDTPILQGGQMTGIYSIDFFDDKNGVIIGGDWNNKSTNTGNKAITNDGGITWHLIADGKDPGYRSCIRYLHNDTPDYIIAVGTPGISISEDQGESWELISEESFYTFRVTEKSIWLAGQNKIARMAMEWDED